MSGMPAVRLTAVFKKYGKNFIVLNGLNMIVRKGTIYGLLGPSGCGKTTLLSCIVGRTRIDSGEINVVYTEKSHLGYMPQDIALFNEFTIEEAFMFYGTVFGLSELQIESRVRFLANLLELPDVKRQIKLCSGGQQRRVSMAVTLFHDPQLLILDEPTVGLDPVLSDKIWQYLMQIVAKEGKTIIITTHYIEEAKNAHCIGLMRGGILLAENNPKVLMAQENTDSLELAFLKLSIKQQHMDTNKEVFQPEGKVPERTFLKNDMFNKSRFWAQYKKNYLSARGQSILSLFVIFLPLLCAVLINFTFYHLPILQPIGVLNEDGYLCNYTEHVVNKCYPQPPEPLSCLMIRYIEDESYTVIYHNSWEEAVDSIRHSKTNGFIHFKPKFSIYMMEKFVKFATTSKVATENSFIFVYTGRIGSPLRLSMERTIADSFKSLLTTIEEKCNYPKGFGNVPIDTEQVVFGKMFDWVPQTVAKFITAFITFANLTFASSNLNSAMNSGCFERDRISGLTLTEIFGAQALFQLYTIIFQNTSAMIILYGVFDVLQIGSYLLIFITLFLVAILGYFYGMLIGVVFRDSRTVSYVSTGFALTLFMVNGYVWPPEGYHWALKPTGWIFSRYYGGELYYNISIRGWGISHYRIWSDIIILICHCLLAAFVTSFYVKRNKEQF